MVRHHFSFLVRWWLLDHGGSRIELEHIQSGARTIAGSPAEALAWMQATAASESGPSGSEDGASAARGDEQSRRHTSGNAQTHDRSMGWSEAGKEGTL